MLAPLHNWKDKLKSVIRKYPKTTTGVLSVVLVFFVMVLGAQITQAGVVEDVVNGFVGALLSLFNMALYYIILTPIFWLTAICVQVMVEVASWQRIINEPAVIAGWTIARDLANMGFVVVLIYIAFGTVISYQKVNWQKDLVKLVFMIILVNFSRMIVGLLIDVSQVVMLTFVNGFRNVAAGNILGTLGLDYYLTGTNNFTTDRILAQQNFVKVSLGILMGLLLLSTIAMLAAWLLLRIVKLWLLTVLSPFYFLAGFFPFMNSFSSYWKKQFTEQLVAGPFMAFGVWFALSVIGQTGQAGSFTTPPGNAADLQSFASATTDVAKQSNSLYTMMIGAGLIYGVFNMSKSMAGEAAIVGTKVWEKGKQATLATAKGIAKTADWTASQIGQRTIGVDTSVGGAKRWVSTKKEQFSEWKTSVEAKSASIAESRRKTLHNLITPSNPGDKLAKSMAAAEKAWEKNTGKEAKKAAKAEMDLKEKKETGGSAADVQAAIDKKDISAAKKVLDDPKNKISEELKTKLRQEVAKMESQEAAGKMDPNVKDGVNSRMSNDFIKFDQSHISALQKGVLTSDEASLLNGKSLADLKAGNPEMARQIEAKLKAAFSGEGMDKNLKNELLRLQTDGINADDLLKKWKTGAINSKDDLATAKSLGVGSDGLQLMQKDSLENYSTRGLASEDNIKRLDKKIEAIDERIERTMRKREADYAKSTSTRARSKRIGELRSKMRKIYDSQYPLLDSVAEQADRFLSTEDPELRDHIINKLKPEDAHEFLRRTGAASDVTGYYELVAKIGKKYDKDMKELLNTLRTTGSLPPADESRLLEKLNSVTADTYRSEIIQALESKLKREVPGVKYATEQDPISGKYSFTSLENRQASELDDLLKRAISPEKFDGFVYKQQNGSYELSDVGFNYFKEAYGRIEKKMQDFNDDYIKALVRNKDEILRQAQVSETDRANMKVVLDKLAGYTRAEQNEGLQRFQRK